MAKKALKTRLSKKQAKQADERTREDISVSIRKNLTDISFRLQGIKQFILTRGQPILRKVLGGDNRTSSLSDIKAAFAHVNPRVIRRNLLIIIVLIYIMSGVYIVKSGEAAVVERFGEVVNPKVGEGLHYRLPWPFEKQTTVNIAQIRREGVGLATSEPEHPLHPETPAKLQVLSGDTNIIDYEVIVEYQVTDPALYLYRSNYPSYQLVRDAVRATVTQISGTNGVDDILTAKRQSILNNLRTDSQKLLDEYASGLKIVNVNFQKAYPPDEVADAFRDVSSAREDKAKAVNEAEGYKNSIIPEARGQAQKAITEASSSAIAQVNEASGSAIAFNGILAQYQTNSSIYGEQVTRFRLYLERMEKIFPNITAYVVKPGERVNLRLLDNNGKVNIFPPQPN